MFDDALVQQLAAELQRAQQTRTQVEHFSKRHPGMTIEDGYRIGRAWVNLQKAEGRKVIGHKIGLTSRAMQVSSQIDEPDYGTLLDDMRYDCTPGQVLDIPFTDFIAPRVEVELAFILKKELRGPNVTVQQVLDATGGQGADLVVDFVAGATMNRNMQATRICGRIVNVGRMGGFTGEFDFDLHSLRRIRYIGVTFRTRSREEVRNIARHMRHDLWHAVTDGSIRLPVHKTFALEDAPDALACMRTNAHFGKIVLTV